MMMEIPPPDARLYLRPIWFIDTPVGLETHEFRRLAGGLIWFQGLEVRWAGAEGTAGKAIVPVAMFEDWQSRLSDAQAERVAAQMEGLTAPRAPLTLGERVIRFDTPQVMGILNMTPDSFSDGGKLIGDAERAADAGFAMQLAGASIIDVGGESTRPGAATVWEGDEIARTVPVIERLARTGIVVSIDTRKAAVMEAALAAGASIVNDVTGLTHDPRGLEVVAKAGCPVILMHSPSAGDDPHGGAVKYKAGAVAGPTADMAVFDWLEARIAACLDAGMARSKIILDPGVGFGKALQDDTRIINNLAMYQALGVPLLFGASRKRIVGALTDGAPVEERLGGSVALAQVAIGLGAQIVRVHDVQESVQAARVWRGLRDAALVAA
ncbi:MULTISPECIES: dihydropteroate synthase [unclassified Sphingobium]|uniref:dihydropteroate synthase n=1 Tax=unclassified Sphingobium TaxID=2611147 RepID=UPI0022251CE1|nr:MULTISPECIES: dihydropteroate synthase [unclassified Sphingobium]MCW2394657.1 dihydropteroate synthase [Sphingobium sp. B8D3B]MCW2418171.1 dihydropteroate synthase [Sphingobium sp. B8D3C]